MILHIYLIFLVLSQSKKIELGKVSHWTQLIWSALTFYKFLIELGFSIKLEKLSSTVFLLSSCGRLQLCLPWGVSRHFILFVCIHWQFVCCLFLFILLSICIDCVLYLLYLCVPFHSNFHSILVYVLFSFRLHSVRILFLFSVWSMFFLFVLFWDSFVVGS